MRLSILSVVLTLLPASVPAADWEPVAADLIRAEKPGYGGLSGVAVEPGTGRVFVSLSDRGVFRSADQGATWERHGPGPVKGRTETPECLQFDPTGKTARFVLPLVYGSPVVAGAGDADAWRAMDKASGHVDWCAVDWTDPASKFVLTLKHEANGLLLASRDGGATFAEVGKGFGPAWVFGPDTAVVVAAKGRYRPKGAILRTTDGGKSFAEVAPYAPVSLPGGTPAPCTDWPTGG